MRAQILAIDNSDTPWLATGRLHLILLKKLPRRDSGPSYYFDDDVTLQYYRLQRISESSISLESGIESEVSGPTSVGTGVSIDETIELSHLIDILNERFGTSFTPADQLFLDSIKEDAVADSNLREVAMANPMENFGYIFFLTSAQRNAINE